MNINHYSEVVKSLSFRVRIMSFKSHNFHILCDLRKLLSCSVSYILYLFKKKKKKG